VASANYGRSRQGTVSPSKISSSSPSVNEIGEKQFRTAELLEDTNPAAALLTHVSALATRSGVLGLRNAVRGMRRAGIAR